MKKLIFLWAIFSLLTTKAMAQESVPNPTLSTTSPSKESSNSAQSKKEKREQRYEKASPEQKAKMDQRRQERKDKREGVMPNSQNSQAIAQPSEGYVNEAPHSQEIRKERRNQVYENASPEQKEKMDRHREMMKNLSPEKRELVKKEMDRHRAEMKKITGFDLPIPINPIGPINK